MGKYTQPPMVI